MTTGLMPVQLPLGQPISFPGTVAGIVNEAVRSMTARPSLGFGFTVWDDCCVMGRGCPGAVLPPLFRHVYCTVAEKTMVPVRFVLPRLDRSLSVLTV